jgi:hypothetical protein
MIIRALPICWWRGQWGLVGIVAIRRVLSGIVVLVVVLSLGVVSRYWSLVRWSGSLAPRPTEHWFVAELDVRWNPSLRRNGSQSLPLSSSAHHHHEKT